MALYDFQSAGIATTDDFNNMMKFFHHYHKELANGKTEDLAKNDAKNAVAGLSSYLNVDDYKKLKSGRFPRRDEMNAIISEFKTYAKGEVDKATDDEKEAQDKFDEAQKVQDEGQDASDQIADIKRERRGIRLKKGITATLLTAAGLCIAGPLVLGGALASSAIIGFSALAGVGFAKFSGDKEIHECGLDDRKLIRDLKQKVREAQRQNANYLAKQRELARQQARARNANTRFNNYEQVGSVYENILEDERSDGRNQLIQLQNDITGEKGKAHFVTSGKGFKDSQATEYQVDNASQVVSNKLTELDNLPMDSSFQSKMETILKDAEKEKAKVVAMDLEHKNFVAEVDNAINAVVEEANAYENYYNSFDESIKADSDVLNKYTACTNVYSVMFGMGSLDNESVPDINNTLADLKSKSSDLKKSIRTKWLEGQNSSALPEGTLEEKAYKRVIQEAENANARANGNTNPSQQANADAIAELNFLRARLSNLEQQRAATGKEDVVLPDPTRGMVLVNVKQEITDALAKVNTGLTAVSSGAKSPTDALNEVTNGIDINLITSGVRILTASAGRSNAPTDDERNKTAKELADIDSRMNRILANFKTKQADKFKFQEATDLFNETSNIKKELVQIKDNKERIKNAATKQELDNIKQAALNKEKEIKAKLREALAKEKELAAKEQQDIAELSKEIEKLYTPFKEKYITKKEDLRSQYNIDDPRYKTATDAVKDMYEQGFTKKPNADKTKSYLGQFKTDLYTKIKEQETEIDNLKQQQNTADPLQERKNNLRTNLDKKITDLEEEINTARGNNYTNADALNTLKEAEAQLNILKGIRDKNEIGKAVDLSAVQSIANNINDAEGRAIVQLKLAKLKQNKANKSQTTQSQGDQGNQGQAAGQNATPPENQTPPPVNQTPPPADQNTGANSTGGGNNQTQAQDIADDNYKKDALVELQTIETSNNDRFNEYATKNGLSDEYKTIGVNALKGVFEKVRENIGNATTKTEVGDFVKNSKDVVNAVKQAVEQLMQNAASATAAENVTPENPPTPPTPSDEQKPAEENTDIGEKIEQPKINPIEVLTPEQQAEAYEEAERYRQGLVDGLNNARNKGKGDATKVVESENPTGEKADGVENLKETTGGVAPVQPKKDDKDKTITELFNEIYSEKADDNKPKDKDSNGKENKGNSNPKADGRVHFEWFPRSERKDTKSVEENANGAKSNPGNENKEPDDKKPTKADCLKYISEFRGKHYLKEKEIDNLVLNNGDGTDLNRLIAICEALKKWEELKAKENNNQAEDDGREM